MYRKCILFCFALIFPLAAEPPENVVILGGGPAGLTSALYAGQANLSPLVIAGEENEGQAANAPHMENFPGFPEGISGSELLHRIQKQAKAFGARFTAGKATAVDLSSRPFKLTLQSGKELYTNSLIIATGSQKRWLGLETEERYLGHGVHASAASNAEQYAGKDVAVIGGGDSALEEALLLSKAAHKVYLIHRGAQLEGVAYLQERAVNQSNLEIILNAEVRDILESQTHVAGVLLKQGEKRLEIPCEGIFVSVGSKPNTDLFKGQLALSPSGHFAVEPLSSKTSVPGVFAAGDVVDPRHRKAVVAAAGGCMAALDAREYLKSHQAIRTYVGELQEKWLLPSDHLPIGVAVSDGRSTFSLLSWNVLNTAFMHWIYHNDQGLSDSVLTKEDVKIKESGLTLREERVIHHLLEMVQSGKQIFCLQECGEPFLQELKTRLPAHYKIVRTVEEPVKNQNVLLYNAQKFTLLENKTHSHVFMDDWERAFLEVILEKNGIRYQIFNAHLRCGSEQCYEFAQFVENVKKEGHVLVVAGDLNVDQLKMRHALAKTSSAFIPFTSYKTNISPELCSKAVDHIFIAPHSHPLKMIPLMPNEVLKDLQKSVNLLK